MKMTQTPSRPRAVRRVIGPCPENITSTFPAGCRYEGQRSGPEWPREGRTNWAPDVVPVRLSAHYYERLGEKVVWQMLQQYAKAVGVPGIAPHDLRRTCAKLCRAEGGELEQIQLLLGHASVQTTERYLGTKQNLVHAPNDAIKLSIAADPEFQ